MARRPLTVLEWNPSTAFSLWILWNFQESFFAEHILATTCDIMLFFFFFADHWGLQTKINLFGGAIRNSQPHPILCSYGNQAEKSLSSCGHTCTDLDIPIAGKVEEKEELKSLLKWGKFSFYVMVDCKIVTYLKNKKQLILIVNKKFKIFDF